VAITTPMTSQRNILTRPAFIFAVALTLRLATGAIFLHDGQLTIDSAGSFTEGSEAVGIAQSLASGHGFGAPWLGAGPTAWLTPVMPAILAADMLVFGLHSRATLIVFIIFNELCSALTIFPVFFAARRIAGGRIPDDSGGDRIAALAAWLCVLDPLAIALACKSIWYTTLSALLAALLLWATLAVHDSKKPAVWIGYGLLWGVELLTHPTFLVLMPVALLWLVWPRPDSRWLDSKRLRLSALACFTAVLCCAPWTVRNFVVFHHFVPLRSDFGFELWRDNHDGPALHPNGSGVEHDAFSSLGEYAYVKERQHEALAWVGTHPVAYMRKTARRVMHFWFDVVYPLSTFVHGGTWFFRVKFLYICALLVMALGGLIIVRRGRREYFWLLASFPAIFPLVYYFALARDFHRVPIDPVLAIIAAFAATAWIPMRRSGATEHSATDR
jgi:4-amino-4-deoxy-L-arabinose transferase-like glycosyltransferase